MASRSSYLCASEYGVETAKGNQCEHEVICPMYAGAMIATSGLAGWGIGVPVTAEEPEAACRLLNVLYTDEYAMNLLVRGVEGTDYTVEDGMVKYPDDSKYWRLMDWSIGNNLLLKPLYGNGADYYEKVTQLNKEAKKSVYLGFVFDSSDYDLVTSQISSVYNTYYPDLFCGNYTPEMFEEYKAKLKAAGIDDYVNAYQTQLSAWMAEN